MTGQNALRIALPPPNEGKGRGADLEDLRFRRLVGDATWEELAPAIRKRFAKRLGPGASVVYKGEIEVTRMNWAGRLLSGALRVMGAPLPLEETRGGLAAVVTVTEDAASNGQFWTRQYNRARGFPQVIHSTKAFAGASGLEEYITRWLGMSLTLEADADCLRFLGEDYFLKLFGRRVFLPRFMSPGRLVVGHHDLGAGQFAFTLDLEHGVLGHLLHQRVRFHDIVEA